VAWAAHFYLILACPNTKLTYRRSNPEKYNPGSGFFENQETQYRLF
jgi:hypothetical protein